MTDISAAGAWRLGDRDVNRMGYGAMQLAGPGVFGPPRDQDAALAVLRAAVGGGVDHIDTSDYYGPHVTNRLIREALHPYPGNLTLVTKLGAVRGSDASWIPALAPADLTAGLHDNLRNLGVEAMDVVNLRDGRPRGAGGRLDRGAVRDAGRAAAPGPDPPSRASATSTRTRSPRRAGSPPSSASRITTISSTAPTTP